MAQIRSDRSCWCVNWSLIAKYLRQKLSRLLVGDKEQMKFNCWAVKYDLWSGFLKITCENVILTMRMIMRDFCSKENIWMTTKEIFRSQPWPFMGKPRTNVPSRVAATITDFICSMRYYPALAILRNINWINFSLLKRSSERFDKLLCVRILIEKLFFISSRQLPQI